MVAKQIQIQIDIADGVDSRQVIGAALPVIMALMNRPDNQPLHIDDMLAAAAQVANNVDGVQFRYGVQ